MRILTFNISGPLACFRKTTTFDTSTEFILTYDFIPLTAVKGLIGAVLGYKGLADAYRNKRQPEYMEKLSDVGIGIEPITIGTKFNHEITNTTGFANASMTGIIRQEVLSDISYNIYITDEFEDFDLLHDKLRHRRTTYPIVLGKKGFNAVISDVRIIDEEITNGYTGVLASLADDSLVERNELDLLDDNEMTYQYSIDLPIGYDESMMYTFIKINYSDEEICYNGDVILSKSIAILR